MQSSETPVELQWTARRYFSDDRTLSLSCFPSEFLLRNINPVRTSQETHYVSATTPNRLLLFKETVAVCRETH
jgi:hypothetical protein